MYIIMYSDKLIIVANIFYELPSVQEKSHLNLYQLSK